MGKTLDATELLDDKLFSLEGAVLGIHWPVNWPIPNGEQSRWLAAAIAHNLA